ncbi:hypothetical protein AVEN_244950-1 [Araneus ventricosus]|uniref:Uncharacterized protein n=1 Tax=Araneus ventricosus TaxID=182803 RepID=A0A4Y2F9D2_ARAVE|nr:hypothetical protein AVEN_244950-1 [Araneus ventricosus]
MKGNKSPVRLTILDIRLGSVLKVITSDKISMEIEGLRWPSGRDSALGAGGFQVRDPIPLKIRRVGGPLHAKSYLVAKRHPAGVARKFGEGVPAQASSSSSDHGLKLRDPSQNSSRVASKQDVNITKPSYTPEIGKMVVEKRFQES